VLAPLQADLDLVGESYRHILSGVSAESQDLVEQSAAFTGKRLRPALTVLAGRIAGGLDPEQRVSADVATVGAIVELIHTATLVHDDILDGASVRRKVATLNARFGEQMAVLAGDVLFSKAYRAAAWLADPFAARYLSEVVGEILDGEIHQDLVAHNPNLSEAEYRKIIRGKTAALYEGALRVGAYYGGAERELTDALAQYGHHLGMAFQIVDDHLDLAGDEQQVGKSLGRDLREGKTTLPVILWIAGLEGSAHDEATALVERAWNDEAAGAEVARRVLAAGSFEGSLDAAKQEIARAQECLVTLPKSDERDLLDQIARYVLERTR
jgi:octaprenyl-diphosphate synthase